VGNGMVREVAFYAMQESAQAVTFNVVRIEEE